MGKKQSKVDITRVTTKLNSKRHKSENLHHTNKNGKRRLSTPQKSVRDPITSARKEEKSTVESILKNLIVGEDVKSGVYYNVCEATSRLDSEKYFLKTIKKQNVTEEKVDKIRKEMEVMKSIEHPNILRLYEYAENDESIVSVSEFVPNNAELFDRIVEKGSFKEEEAIAVVEKILDAVCHLHSIGVVHRDLKPENVICYMKGKEEVVKLAGFEISAIQNDEARLFTSIGTPCYIAPEVILCVEGYKKEVDMWGIGIITYMLLAGFPPFCVEDNNEAKLIQLVVTLGYNFDDAIWKTISEQAKDFIKNLLVKEPSKRLTVEQAKNHPWMK